MKVKRRIFLSGLVAAVLLWAWTFCAPGYGAMAPERRVEEEKYPSGEKKSVKHFLNELLEKTEEFFPRDGVAHDRLKIEEFYDAGKLSKKKEYYGGGQLKSEGVYEHGQLVSLKEYGENRKLKREAAYKDGELNGLAKEYYLTGSLECEKVYRNGKLDGPVKEYYETGLLKTIKYFKEKQ